MKLGVLLGPANSSDTGSLAKQARMLEQEGYENLWSAQAMGKGFTLTDPFITLATAVTGKVALGERLGRYADAGFDDALVMFQPGGPVPADVRKRATT